MLVQRSATLPRQEGASAEEGERRGWFTDFHGREGGRHGLGIKPTALGFVGPKLSLPVGPVCHLLSLFEVKERERE